MELLNTNMNKFFLPATLTLLAIFLANAAKADIILALFP